MLIKKIHLSNLKNTNKKYSVFNFDNLGIKHLKFQLGIYRTSLFSYEASNIKTLIMPPINPRKYIISQVFLSLKRLALLNYYPMFLNWGRRSPHRMQLKYHAWFLIRKEFDKRKSKLLDKYKTANSYSRKLNRDV